MQSLSIDPFQPLLTIVQRITGCLLQNFMGKLTHARGYKLLLKLQIELFSGFNTLPGKPEGS